MEYRPWNTLCIQHPDLPSSTLQPPKCSSCETSAAGWIYKIRLKSCGVSRSKAPHNLLQQSKSHQALDNVLEYSLPSSSSTGTAILCSSSSSNLLYSQHWYLKRFSGSYLPARQDIPYQGTTFLSLNKCSKYHLNAISKCQSLTNVKEMSFSNEI